MSDLGTDLRSRCGTLALVAILALLVRGGYVATLSDVEFLKYDGVDYRDIAKNIADGNGFTIDRYRWFEPRRNDSSTALRPELHRPPLLPYIGAALHRCPGGFLLAAQVLSVLVGSLAVFGAGRLGESLFGRRVGVAAAILVALHPYLIDISCRWSTENFMMLASLLGMCAMRRFSENASIRDAASAGAFFAIAVLARPSAIVILAVVSFWIILRARRERRTAPIVAYLLAAAIVLLPWTIRNMVVSGHATPLTSFGPYNMRIGMNDIVRDFYRGGAVDTDRMTDGVMALTDDDLAEFERDDRPSDVEDFWRRKSFAYARANPGDAAFIIVARALHFWRPWTHGGSGSIAIRLACGLWAGLILGAAIAAVATRKSPRTPILILPVLAVFASSLPFIFNIRYRLPVVEPVVAILAAEFMMRRGAIVPGRKQISNSMSIGASEGCAKRPERTGSTAGRTANEIDSFERFQK